MSNLDTLLNELSSFSFPDNATKPAIKHQPVDVNDENINDYILKKTASLIDTGLGAVEDLKDFVIQGQNPDEIAALSELISSTTKAIEALNRINLQNKKAKTDKELKVMDLQNRKEVAGMLPGNTTVNNNLIVASREEIFKQLLDNAKDETPVIEIIDTPLLEEKEDK
jgi:hypothetical protein